VMILDNNCLLKFDQMKAMRHQSAYLNTNLDVKDANDFEEYRAKVPALIRKHGGEYLVAEEPLLCYAKGARITARKTS
jgi:uncharacterized protein (DUF1330 family)